MKIPPHPLEEAFRAKVSVLATTLRPATLKNYQHTVRLFMKYLRQNFPEVRRGNQLKRDPHILGWLEYLWTQKVSSTQQPLHAHSRAAHLLRLRRLLEMLADHRYPPPAGLLWAEDIPRQQQTLPRPLSTEDDERLKTELRRRNDLLSNALLLTRLAGMRPGEMVDLALNCLHHSVDGHWLLHVPAVKVYKERWVPIDEEGRNLVGRLTYLRTLSGTGPAGSEPYLLPRPDGRQALAVKLREALLDAAKQVGIIAPIVPYQLRHTFATTMLRAGVSLCALMKLLGHKTANMTLTYVEITQQDVQREFELVRLKPRHQIPVPRISPVEHQDAADAPAIVRSLSAAIGALDVFRKKDGAAMDKPLQLISRRLVRIRSRFQKLVSDNNA
jgi:site-specific recombinase XerD